MFLSTRPDRSSQGFISKKGLQSRCFDDRVVLGLFQLLLVSLTLSREAGLPCNLNIIEGEQVLHAY